jgi:hypothetical protein
VTAERTTPAPTAGTSSATYSPGSPLPWPDRWLLVDAAFCLALARLSVLIVPFRWLTRALRQQLGETPVDDDCDMLRQRERVAWALRTVNGHTPWDSNCLAQGLAGKLMLRRRRLVSTLYLGVGKDDQASFAAHAWLRSGAVVVTGGADLERFTVMAAFRDASSGARSVLGAAQ